MIAGLAELAIGMWVASSLHASITALLAWVGAGTVAHGIGEIRSAFLVRKIGQHAAPATSAGDHPIAADPSRPAWTRPAFARPLQPLLDRINV